MMVTDYNPLNNMGSHESLLLYTNKFKVYWIHNVVETECSINQIHYGLMGSLGRPRLEAVRGIVRESDCYYKLFLIKLISKSGLKMPRWQL